jgi:hypothetical protein
MRWITEFESQRICRSWAAEISTTTIRFVSHSQASTSIAGIGEEAARIALGILNLKVPSKPKTLVLQPELVVRESTQRRMIKSISKKARTGVKGNQSR